MYGAMLAGFAADLAGPRGVTCLFCPATLEENVVPQTKTGRLQKPPADDAWQQRSRTVSEVS